MLNQWRLGLTAFYVAIGIAMVAAATVIGLQTVGHRGPLVWRDRLLAVAVVQALATRGLVRGRFRRRWWRWPLVGIALISGVVLGWTLAVESGLLVTVTDQVIVLVLYLTSLAYLILSILSWLDEVGTHGRSAMGGKTGKHERGGHS